MHGLVGGYGPESVEVHVDGQKPNDQGEGSQLGLETNSHEDNESCTHQILQDLKPNTNMHFRTAKRIFFISFHKDSKRAKQEVGEHNQLCKHEIQV